MQRRRHGLVWHMWCWYLLVLIRDLLWNYQIPLLIGKQVRNFIIRWQLNESPRGAGGEGRLRNLRRPLPDTGKCKKAWMQSSMPGRFKGQQGSQCTCKAESKTGCSWMTMEGYTGAVCVGPYKALWGLRLSLNPRGAAFFNRGRCPCCCVWKETLQLPERVRGISFNPTLTTTPSNAQGLCSVATVYSLCQVFFHLISFQIRVSDAVSGC